MNPIELSEILEQSLQSYLTTIFNVNRDGREAALAAEIGRSFEKENALAKGPYLEITPPYKTGCSLKDLIDEDLLSPKLLDLSEDSLPLPLNARLYSHQEDAIRKLVSEKRNIVVSSGTGSGKTECFLIPILNDLLQDSTPGVRALLIYPLNALVNDQLDRLRKLLRGTDITFGRYTSELLYSLDQARRAHPDSPENEIIAREQIRVQNKIPQILITNYAMLEYLLLRPEDSPLFQSGLWRYIVLDEAHTYSGAQGIEVSMLMRRLKHRLEKDPGDVQCIATSATLTNDDASEATVFADNLFGESFEEPDIIFGDPDYDYALSEKPHEIDPQVYLHDEFDNIIEAVRQEQPATAVAGQIEAIGLMPPSFDRQELSMEHEGNARGLVYAILRDNRDMIKLREQLLELDPVELSEFADEFFGGRLHDTVDRKQALYRLVELGALARPKEDVAPLLPARYHMFMRSPQGIWLCLNPDCSGRPPLHNETWSKVFSTRHETCDCCSCKVYPISVCRDCGQMFLRTIYINNGQYFSEPPDTPNDLTPKHDIRYLLLHELEEDRSLGSNDNDSDEEPGQQQAKYDIAEVNLCLRCGTAVRGTVCQCVGDDDGGAIPITLNILLRDEGTRGRIQFKPCPSLSECPRCRSKARDDTEQATAVSIGGNVPLSILTYELYRRLPPSTNLDIRNRPGNGRKLLSFTDSRQGAARFASYLESTVTMQNYQNIVPDVVREFIQQNGFPPSFSLLTRGVRNKAWALGIFHNDHELGSFWRNHNSHREPDDQQRIELNQKVYTELLSAFTTGRSRRTSMESLGLVAVRYKCLKDIVALADELQLETAMTKTLLAYLLDRLRKEKVLEFPNGVKPAAGFGRLTGHPTLIRGGQTQGYQQLWIGTTERHNRRQYVKQVLRNHGLLSNEDAVIHALNVIFDWLIDPKNHILVGSASVGFRIDYNTLLFDTANSWYRCRKCQRLYAHGPQLPCPHLRCDGTLVAIGDIAVHQKDNYFYQSFAREVVPLRVEEHTAQLTSDRGREYQEKFRRGEINVLSCSTTFEMGIDLGDLQAVAMSNVPPTVANYRQRSGRAGRRAGGAAFILTWTSDRPHDQSYYRNPPDIIGGKVRIPYIAVDNPHIQRRHINAILLSQFLRYRQIAGATNWRTIDTLFGADNIDDPHLEHLEPWLEDRQPEIDDLLWRFARSVNSSEVLRWIDDFHQDVTNAYEAYSQMAHYYDEQYDELVSSLADAPRGRRAAIHRDMDNYDRLLNRLRSEYLIDFLSSRGVLPSYSFPIDAVELQLPPDVPGSSQLRLQRDRKLAIREYAPESEVVADKRIWRSDGVQFYKDTPVLKEYRICETCNHLNISEGPSIPLADVCPICAGPNASQHNVPKFIIPDGFFATRRNNGKAAGQYVRPRYSRMKSALFPSKVNKSAQIMSLVSYSYDRDGRLLYVNEGDVRYGARGFYIQLDGDDRGRHVTNQRERRNMTPVSLGHERPTDTLHLQFICKQHPDNLSFWISLMYALIHGASRALQIERTDIDGVLFPRRTDESGDWQQTIVLYDDVPSGAGHVQQIRKEFAAVVLAALNVANCEDCASETSCYSCLRDYNNQLYHHVLRREEIIQYLGNLHEIMARQMM